MFLPVDTAFAASVVASLSATTFNWAVIRSAAWHSSSVFFRVRFDSQSSLSRTLLFAILITSRSLKISSGVMLEKAEPSASFFSTVLYWPYVSPGCCCLCFKQYRSKGSLYFGSQYSWNCFITGSIFSASAGVGPRKRRVNLLCFRSNHS